MKKILLSLAVVTTLFSSCKKDDNGDNDVTNTWIINDQVHNVVNTGRLGGNFTIFANDGSPLNDAHGLTFAFAGNPTTGVYKIVDYPTKPNEVSIIAQNGGIEVFHAVATNGDGSASGQVRIVIGDNNKATITIFDAVTLQPLLPTGSSSLELKANFREM